MVESLNKFVKKSLLPSIPGRSKSTQNYASSETPSKSSTKLIKIKKKYDHVKELQYYEDPFEKYFKSDTPKSEQIQQRQKVVFILWIWGKKQYEIADLLKVSLKTVTDDLSIVKGWINEQKITFPELQARVQEALDNIMGDIKIDIERIKSPRERLFHSNRAAHILLEIWKKLTPDQVTLHRTIPTHQSYTKEEWEKKQAELRKRAEQPTNPFE